MEATTLQIVDVVGTWIASIGTVGAVITSLWIANNSNKVKLNVSASARVLIDSTRNGNPSLCYISIVNIGNKIAKINSIGWKIKRGKNKQEFFQNTNGSIADKVPLTLQEGDDATITIEFNGEANWLESITKAIQGYSIKDLKLVVVTNTENFEVFIDESLVKEIMKERKRLSEL
ncbi:hypothetical protein [Poseidonibacter ostreae]|jgi:hypothetical protein|uniref:Uncharacterized protein n=2 Tax=Poseidonibacter ostreae TaxID=2654171 RepID=A0A6L4WN19_9BACT|nr:hypothetical protein [Poseidonibacter ostreae]KAB7881234.1 hypothetical protein GBG19_16535 [Poseidonibacter ostreae]KAB7887214.1 hypothetical protein GBG18_14190 [Poseidonibacter ostreae]MAC84693.1 hypothetical protein [Arcobacter sp.]|tara:strand:- start:4709 stop:5233 length:525 start_codon:yes stop_codon:yes gene_type:complete